LGELCFSAVSSWIRAEQRVAEGVGDLGDAHLDFGLIFGLGWSGYCID
jgi:hypothetical protein